MKITYAMYREEEKKHSWRYKSDPDNSPLRPVTFYIPKADIENDATKQAPKNITVTIEDAT